MDRREYYLLNCLLLLLGPVNFWALLSAMEVCTLHMEILVHGHTADVTCMYHRAWLKLGDQQARWSDGIAMADGTLVQRQLCHRWGSCPHLPISMLPPQFPPLPRYASFTSSPYFSFSWGGNWGLWQRIHVRSSGSMTQVEETSFVTPWCHACFINSIYFFMFIL